MSDVNNISPELQYRTGIAERGKFWVVDSDYLTSIGYPTTGEGKYAVLTYQINNPAITLSGDINLGAVEIKDNDSDTRTDVVAFTSSNALATFLVDANGDQITSFGGAAEGTIGDVAIPTVVQLGGIAETTIPTAVADGDVVGVWFDEYGRQVIAGYNQSVDAIDVNTVNDPILSRLGPINNLNDAVTGGAGASIDLSNYHNLTVQCVSTGTPDATVYVEHSLNGTNWTTIGSFVVSASGNDEVSYSNYAMKYIRTRVGNYVDGTFNTYVYGGN